MTLVIGPPQVGQMLIDSSRPDTEPSRVLCPMGNRDMILQDSDVIPLAIDNPSAVVSQVAESRALMGAGSWRSSPGTRSIHEPSL